MNNAKQVILKMNRTVYTVRLLINITKIEIITI